MTPSALGGIRRASAIPGKLGSSPSGSLRRDSQLNAMFQDQSPVQAQLAEVNNRYDMIGIRLGDRDTELNNRREELKTHVDNMKQIHSFLEKQERNLPGEGIPSDRKDADKVVKMTIAKALKDSVNG